jgi:uncharacterized membrane protein
MRVEACTDIQAAPSLVWSLITDPSLTPKLMEGVSRWEVDGDIERGLGARYRVRMHVGSAEVGGLVEVVEAEENRDLAWTSVTGIDHRGRWRLRQPRPGCTRVTLRLAYSAPGGLLGLVADRFAAPMVRSNLSRTLDHLKAGAEAAART